MSLQTACAHCGKPYRAADSMAGRRVRCRDCGGVFLLTRETSPTTVPDITPARKADVAPARPPNGVNAASPAGELAPDVAGAFKIPAAAATTPAPHRSDTPNPLDAPDLTAAIDSDTVFAQAFSQAPPPTLRPNYLHSFPYAYLMDRWVPPVAVGVVSLCLLLRIVLGNEAGVVWAIPLRIVVVLAGFLLIALPLGWIGMTIGCRWGGFARPPSPLYRVAAATWFSFALLVLLWLLAGSLAGAIPGVFVALVTAAGLAWLLYRPQPEESLQSMAAAAGAFVVAVGVYTGALIGLNAAVLAIARDSGTPPELVSSPVGPGLAWELPTASPAVAERDPTPNPVEPPSTASTDMPTSQLTPVPATRPLPVPPTRPAVAVAPATRPNVPATIASLPDSLESSRLFGPASRPTPPPDPDEPPPPDPQPPTTLPPAVPSIPPVASTVPAVASALPPTGDPLGDRIAAARSPMVAKVVATGNIGTFERAVFPVTPSSMALLVRPAGGFEGDALEVWNLATQVRVGSRLVRISGERDPAGNYAVSPDGQLVARIDTFPTLGIELTSFTDAPPPPRVAFPKTFGQARLMAFLDAARVLVRWDESDKAGLQVVDIKRQTFGKGIDLPVTPLSPASFAVHPEGRMFAVVVEGKSATGEAQAELFIADVQSGQSRRIPIQGIDRQWAASPTGVSFAADGRKLAILYEREGKAAILWLALDGRTLPNALQQFRAIVPPEVGTMPPEEGVHPATPRLEALPDGRSWLVGGNAVVDADTGKPRGLLGVPELVGSRALPDAVAIIRDDEGPRRLVIVRLATSATQPATMPAR